MFEQPPRCVGTQPEESMSRLNGAGSHTVLGCRCSFRTPIMLHSDVYSERVLGNGMKLLQDQMHHKLSSIDIFELSHSSAWTENVYSEGVPCVGGNQLVRLLTCTA